MDRQWDTDSEKIFDRIIRYDSEVRSDEENNIYIEYFMQQNI